MLSRIGGSKAIRVKVNPALLIWARNSAGYQISDIAKSIRVSPSVIEEWEQGEVYPTVRQLESFANKVKRPLAALFLPAPPEEPPMPKDFRRLPADALGKFLPETLLAFRKARRIQRVAVELMEALGEYRQPEIPVINLTTDPEDAALEIREHLGVAMRRQVDWRDLNAALDSWRNALSEKGAFVLQFPMPLSDVRAFSLLGDKLSIIAVNSNDARAARIFSMIHEYCHLCLRKPGVSDLAEDAETTLPKTPEYEVETYCNRFAAALLLPLTDKFVYKSLGDLAEHSDLLGTSKAVADKFKVSPEVVLGRLRTANLISQPKYEATITRYRQELTRRKARTKGGPPPYISCVSERGKRFVSLVFDALDREQISLREAMDYLSLSPTWFHRVRERLATGGSGE